ncbi:MAG: hypothetical protein WDK95_15410, partial [Syntrophorhabdaceae bacterium]
HRNVSSAQYLNDWYILSPGEIVIALSESKSHTLVVLSSGEIGSIATQFLELIPRPYKISYEPQ